ncbi:hypothetical protein CFB40_13870 [Burkholderia sp. AU31652]|uniref:DUF2917 domain-containing protein n=1 Tax=Burkholderia contaminans TaxID=488447 RepID=A0A6P3BHI7_9BURK|nr:MULTISPECIES: DUF2917 domain-containing protein [Burkholderia]OXI86782.1 hypothetical protein CFB40_13870 [Burkholderia sp. AU31652]VWD59642.1 hypothetical protein BCO71171_06405 [Burkholderia contaminans]
MRELRLYVIDGDEPAGRWRIVDRTSLEVADGEIWVTIEGLPDDHWLGAGDSLMLTRGMRVWVSAGSQGATFAFGPLEVPARRAAQAWWRPLVAWRDGRRHAPASLPT